MAICKRWIFGLITIGLFIGMTPALVTPSAAVPVVSISEIQGEGFVTPYEDVEVQTSGIVTADYQQEDKRGFFLQDPLGDGNPATSDGIFIYDTYPDVNVGDFLVVTGYPSEYYGMTQFYKPWYDVESTGNPLPAPVELNPPFDDDESDLYYEALEGMLVSVENLRAVAGTNQFGEVAGVRNNLRIKRVFQDDPAGTGELIFIDEGGGVLVNAISGTRIKGLVGPLDYTYGEYKVLPGTMPQVRPSGQKSPRPLRRATRGELSIATYNMLNLFDHIADPGKLQTPDASSIFSPEEVTLKLAKHAHAIHDFLREPDLIAVQEVEKKELLEQLVATPPITAPYAVELIPGPDERGINVGLLYRTDRVSILSAEAHQTTTTLDDGYGPPSPPNDPNLLFSRPPLVVHLEIKEHGMKKPHDEDSLDDLWVIINHFKSKSTYAPYYAPTTPRRVEQAAFVGSLVDEIQMEDPHARVMVMGDFNDFEDTEPLLTLEAGGLSNLVFEVKKKDRYTYIYNGVSEVLDHMLVTPSLEDAVRKVRIAHFNPDFPEPVYGEDPDTGIWSSDHDVLMAYLDLDDFKAHDNWDDCDANDWCPHTI